MKLKGFLVMMVAATTMTAGLTACDEEDEPIPTIDPVIDLIGGYEGYTLYSSAYFDAMSYGDVTVVVTRHEDNLDAVDVRLESLELGNYTFIGAELGVADDGATTLSGAGTMSMAGHGTLEVKTYDAMMTAALHSKDDFEFTFTTDIMGGSTLTVKSGTLPAARAVAGTVMGNIESKVMGQSFWTEGIRVRLTYVDDETVNVVIPEMTGLGAMKTAGFTIEGVKVTASGDGYALAPTDYMASAGGTTYSGTLTGGTVVRGETEIDFTLQPGAMPFAIECSFYENISLPDGEE